MDTPETKEEAPSTYEPHARIVSAIEFLRDFQKLRFKEETDYRRQQWHLLLDSLPDHASIQLQPEQPDQFLIVQRAELREAPNPVVLLRPWIEGDWRKPQSKLSLRESIPRPEPAEAEGFLKIEDHPQVQQAWRMYSSEWADWAVAEVPARESRRIYETLYDLRAQFQREPEVYELFVADGVVAWRLNGTDVFHPVMLQRVELVFTAVEAMFSIGVAGTDPSMFSGVVAGADHASVTAFGQFKDRLASSDDTWPLAGEQADLFLKGFANSLNKGRLSNQPTSAIGADPVVFRQPMLLCARRGLGMAQFIDDVLKHVQELDVQSLVLEAFVGYHSESENEVGGEGERFPDEDETVYFTREANKEQLDIIRQYRAGGSVVVQGPPGTGKTHTIANLIGHFLAEGKSILVTAETTKALKVLRDKVAAPLRPLCVSLLDSDREGRDLLESGIHELSRIKSGTTSAELDRQIDELQGRRQKLVRSLKAIRRDLSIARKNEIVTMHVCGREYKPSEAAKLVTDLESVDGWIPGPIEPNSVPPLSDQELATLYESGVTVTPQDELNDPGRLPEIERLTSPSEVSGILDEYLSLKQSTPAKPTFWSGDPREPGKGEQLATLESALAEAVDSLGDGQEEWRFRLVEEGSQTAEARLKWDQVFDLASSIATKAANTAIETARHGILIGTIEDLREAKDILREIQAHLRGGKSLTLLSPAKWKRLLREVTTSNGQIKRAEEAAAALALLELKSERNELSRIWAGVAIPVGLPSLDPEAGQPESQVTRLADAVRSCLSWISETWEPLQADLRNQGFDLTIANGLVPATVSAKGVVRRIISMCDEVLAPALKAARGLTRLHDLAVTVQEQATLLQELNAGIGSPLLRDLSKSVQELDAGEYLRLYTEYGALLLKSETIRLRRTLLEKLRPFARTWCEELSARRSGAEKPGEIRDAWTWRLLEQELVRRQELSVSDLQREKAKTVQGLGEVITDLAKHLAWRKLHDRVTPSKYSALKAFAQASRRTTGLKAAVMAREAKVAMAEAESAVPVWIMPLDRVARSFDPSKTSFDVVIMDEASQIGLTGLAALHLAKSAIIVGDDKQNEPRVVGIPVAQVQGLQEAHLQQIPRKGLWDEKMSVYRLAKICLNRELSLWEHFRCVPQIISFSSLLSYDGKIRPLREDSEVVTRPFVVSCFVPDGESVNKRNRNEALYVASLLKAMSELDEYAAIESETATSFGCAVLRGGPADQVRLVQDTVRKYLGDIWIEDTRFQCGTSADFQGDERDVMILSMVDAPEASRTLQRLQSAEQNDEMYRKIYNVAASRARNQMWIVSSLQRHEHLQERDIRRRLLEFASEPGQWLRQATEENPKAESEFERLVYKDLVSRGYRVTPQFSVGAYRIDLVAQCGQKRCAIECDGDRFHTGDNLDKDMERQAILERCGWRFVRIRGTRYYRNPGEAMAEAYAEMASLGIHPEESFQYEEQENTQLLDRVLARAQSLRLEWSETPPASQADSLTGAEDPFAGE